MDIYKLGWIIYLFLLLMIETSHCGCFGGCPCFGASKIKHLQKSGGDQVPERHKLSMSSSGDGSSHSSQHRKIAASSPFVRRARLVWSDLSAPSPFSHKRRESSPISPLSPNLTSLAAAFTPQNQNQSKPRSSDMYILAYQSLRRQQNHDQDESIKLKQNVTNSPAIRKPLTRSATATSLASSLDFSPRSVTDASPRQIRSNPRSLRSALKKNGHQNQTKRVHFEPGLKTHDDHATLKTTNREQTRKEYNYTHFKFDTLHLTANRTTRLIMLCDIIVAWTLDMAYDLKHAFNEIGCFLHLQSSRSHTMLIEEYIKLIQTHATLSMKFQENFIPFIKTIPSYFRTKNSDKQFDRKIQTYLTIFIPELFGYHEQLKSIHGTNPPSSGTSSDADEDDKYHGCKTQIEQLQKTKYNRAIRKNKKLTREWYSHKTRGLMFDIRDINNAIMSLNALFQYFETFLQSMLHMIVYETLPDTSAAMTLKWNVLWVKSILTELKDTNIFDCYMYGNLLNQPPVSYISALITQALLESIRGYVGIPVLFKFGVVAEHIISDINVKNNTWNIDRRMSYYTNNPPKKWSQLQVMNEYVQTEYKHLLGVVDTFDNERAIAWADNFYLRAAVILSEFGGYIAFENLYRGDGRIYDWKQYTTKMYFEYPMPINMNLTTEQVLKMNQSQRLHINDEYFCANDVVSNILNPRQ
eukprot:85685_1